MTVYHRPQAGQPWALLGRYRCHTQPIVQILFGLDQEQDTVLLYTLGKDRRLCEFNLSESSLSSGLKMSSRLAVEQQQRTAQPTSLALLPTWGGEQASFGHL